MNIRFVKTAAKTQQIARRDASKKTAHKVARRSFARRITITISPWQRLSLRRITIALQQIPRRALHRTVASVFLLFASSCYTTAQNITFTSRALSGIDGYVQTALYIETKLIKARAAYSLKPTPKLNTYAVCITPFALTRAPKLLTVYAGTIGASGVFSRAKTPAFSLPDSLSNPSVPTMGLRYSMPTVSTSPKTARALGAKMQLSSFTVSTFLQLPQTSLDETPTTSLAARLFPKPQFFPDVFTRADVYEKLPIEKCIFGIDFNPKANKSGVLFKSSLYAGRHTIRIKQTAAEKKKNLPEETHDLNFGMFESALSGRNAKLFLSTNISEYPNGYFSTWARLQGGYKNRFTTFNAGVFRSTLHHWSLSGSQQNKTLSAYLNPQVRLVSFGTVPKSIHVGARLATERTYSTAKVPVKSVRTSFTTEVLYKCGVFSFNPQFTLEKALHAKERFFKPDEKTQLKASASLTVSPVVNGQTHRYGVSTSYSFYPVAANKTRDFTAKANASIPVGSLININGEHSVTYKTKVPDKKNPVPIDTKTFFPYSYSSKLRLQLTPVTKSTKTVLSLEERFKQNLEKDELPTIVFYCVCTLYIKP